MTYILITRPLEAALELAGQIEALDFTPIVMPLYTFSCRQPGQDIGKILGSADNRTLLVFTSPRAVEFGLGHIPQDLLDKLEFVAIGPATCALLEANGRQVHMQPSSGFTSEDLLKMPALAKDPGKAVIFCAPGGREKLANGLRDMGWEVCMAMVYQRQAQEPAQHQVDSLLGAGELLTVWTSVAACELAREYLPELAWNKILHAPALVISSRIKHHLHQAGVRTVELTAGPGNSGLLQSIKGFRTWIASN